MRTKLFILTIISLLAVSFVYSDEQPQTKPGSSDELNTKIERWIDDLFSYDDVITEKAYWKLCKAGEKAIPFLITKLRSFNYDEFSDDENEEAEDYFRKIKHIMIDLWRTAHPAIKELLKDDSLTLRAFALDVLDMNRDVPADMASPILHSLDYDFSKYEFDDLEDEEDETFAEYFIDMYVYGALQRVRIKGVKTLISALEDKNKYIRYAAASLFDDKYIFTDEVKTLAYPIFVKALEDEYYHVRHCAITALGYIGDSSVVKLILPFLSDSNSYIQECAEYTLLDQDCKSIIPDLIKLLDHDDLEVKSSAAQILKKYGDATAVPALLKNLNIDNEWKRHFISSAIYELIDETSIPYLVKAVNEKNGYIRAAALNCLIKLDYESIIPLVLEYTGDENPEVRKYVARAIGYFGDKSHIPILLKLINDESDDVKAKAAWGLGNIGEKSDEIYKALRDTLKSEDNYVRMKTVEAINKIGDKSFIPDLETLLYNKKYKAWQYHLEMRWAALETHVKLSGIKSIEFLKKFMNDYKYIKTPGKIIELVESLDDKSKIDDNPAIDFYTEAIVNGVGHYTSEVLNAIGDRKNELILKALSYTLINSENKYKREMVSEKLVKFADKSTLPALIKGLKDSNNKVRGNCIDAISEIGDKSQVEVLIPLLKDPYYFVRMQAIWAIDDLDGKNQYKHFIPLLDDENDSVRDNALRAIARLADDSNSIFKKYFETSENIREKLTIAVHFLKEKQNVESRKIYIDFIIKQISNSDKKIQASAINCIIEIKEKTAVPALLKILENDQNANFSIAIGSLGSLGDKSVVPKLIYILEENYDSRNRRIAAESLGEIGDISAFDNLVKAMQEDIEGLVRARCAKALGNLNDKRAIPYLIEALKDVYTGDGFHVNFDVQRYAVKALGKLRAKEALEPLKKLEEEYKWSNVPDKYCEYEYQYPMKRVYLAILEAIKQIEGNE